MGVGGYGRPRLATGTKHEVKKGVARFAYGKYDPWFRGVKRDRLAPPPTATRIRVTQASLTPSRVLR